MQPVVLFTGVFSVKGLHLFRFLHDVKIWRTLVTNNTNFWEHEGSFRERTSIQEKFSPPSVLYLWVITVLIVWTGINFIHSAKFISNHWPGIELTTVPDWTGRTSEPGTVCLRQREAQNTSSRHLLKGNSGIFFKTFDSCLYIWMEIKVKRFWNWPSK